MIQWKRISALLLTFACLLTLVGCDDIEKQKALAEAEQAKTEAEQAKIQAEQAKTQLVKLQADLEKTQSERDTFKVDVTKMSESLREAEAKFAEVTQARDDLKGQINEINVSRDELQKQVSQLAGSRNKLQQQIKNLTQSRDELKQKVDTLYKVRDGLQKRTNELIGLWMAALTDAKIAQTKIQELAAQLQRNVTDISGLNDRIATLELSFVQLKKRLEWITVSSAEQL